MSDGGVNIDVGLNLNKAEKDLQKLKDKIARTEDQLNKDSARKTALSEQIAEVGAKADEATEKVMEIKKRVAESRGSTKADYKIELAEALEDQKLLVKETNSLTDEYVKVSNQIDKGTESIAQMKNQAGDMQRAIARVKPGEAIARSMNNAKKSMIQFLKYSLGIQSVLFLFRRLRTYISDAVGAFAEQDAETKSNIDSLKASLSTLRASWGAAFAPILNAVAPILQKLIGWLTTAANAINMFFSALMGRSTYKKVTAGMNSAAASASGAADAVDEAAESAEEAKKQLMDFDEIRTLDATDKDSNKAKGGSGGGGGAGGFAETEEELINPKVKAFVEWLRDHLLEIQLIAGTIGAILLAWKLSNKLGIDFKTILGVMMIIYGAALLVKGALDAWQNGINWDNLRMMLGGIAIAAVGAAIAFGTVGAAIALLVGGVTLLVLGFREWIKTGELSKEVLTAIVIGIGLVATAIALLTHNGPLGLLIAGIGLLVVGIMDWIKTGELSQRTFQILVNGILLVGAAIALMTHSWLPLLIAGIAILVLAIVKNWDTIKEKTIEIWTKITDWLKETWQGIKDKALEYFGPLLDDIKLIWDGIKNIFQGVVDFVAGIFTGDWDRAWSGIQNIFTGVAEVIIGTISSLFDWFGGLIQACRDALAWLGGVFSGMNQVAERNARFNEETGNLYATDPSQLRGYATGGIVDRATALIAGENGKEAIVPLEQNTGWIDMLANGILSSMAKSDFANQLAGAFSSVPMPAMAGGVIAPPNAISGGTYGSGTLMEEIRALRGEISALANQPIEVRSNLYMDKRKVGESVAEYQRTNGRAKGT